MDLIDELDKVSQLQSDEDVITFCEIIQKMTYSGKDEYLPAMLLCLNDDSLYPDVMKDIIGMCECYSAEKYVPALVSLQSQIRDKAPDWLEIILSRISNSPKHNRIYQELTLNQNLQRKI